MTNTNTAPQEAQQEQLAPCPFCGSQPQLVRLGTGNGFSYSYHCPNTDCLATNGKFDAWVSAIIAWNRRAREDELRARVAELEGQLAEARKWVPSHTYQSGGVTFPLSQAMVQDAIEDTVWDETLSDDTEATDGQ